MSMFVFDTETSNDGDENAWIWSWALCDEEMDVKVGNGLDALDILLSLPDRSDVYVHNLPYDGEYLYWLLIRRGYVLAYGLNPFDAHHGCFDILADGGGIITMTIYTEGRRVMLHDSLRIFRAPLRDLPRICGFNDVTKGELDYLTYRAPDHVPTPEERDYQVRDVQVLMRAMQWVRQHAERGNTIGSIAKREWRATVGRRSPFKPLTVDQRKWLQTLYYGGVVYLPPERCGQLISGVEGKVYDRNSMYPSEMVKPLPVRIMQRVDGYQYDGDGIWAHHVLIRDACLKQDGFPLLITPWTGSGREVIDALDRWLYHDEYLAVMDEYRVGRVDVVESVKFAADTIAADFVRKWYDVKQHEPERRSYAKYMLNNLSGKWGESPIHEQIRRRVLPDGDYTTYRANEIDEKPDRWAYMPAVAYVTSQSRLCLRETAVKAGRRNLLYTDTDSVHTLGRLPDDMVDPGALGAWDLETTFSRAMYIKPKSYWETGGNHTVHKHAGINYDATLAVLDRRHGYLIDSGEPIGPENMRPGNYFYTRTSRRVKGGIIIERTPKIL